MTYMQGEINYMNERGRVEPQDTLWDPNRGAGAWGNFLTLEPMLKEIASAVPEEIEK